MDAQVDVGMYGSYKNLWKENQEDNKKKAIYERFQNSIVWDCVTLLPHWMVVGSVSQDTEVLYKVAIMLPYKKITL